MLEDCSESVLTTAKRVGGFRGPESAFSLMENVLETCTGPESPFSLPLKVLKIVVFRKVRLDYHKTCCWLLRVLFSLVEGVPETCGGLESPF